MYQSTFQKTPVPNSLLMRFTHPETKTVLQNTQLKTHTHNLTNPGQPSLLQTTSTNNDINKVGPGSSCLNRGLWGPYNYSRKINGAQLGLFHPTYRGYSPIYNWIQGSTLQQKHTKTTHHQSKTSCSHGVGDQYRATHLTEVICFDAT